MNFKTTQHLWFCLSNIPDVSSFSATPEPFNPSTISASCLHHMRLVLMQAQEVRLLKSDAADAAHVTLGRLPAVVEPSQVNDHVVPIGKALAALGTRVQDRNIVLVVCANVFLHARLAAVRLAAARAAHLLQRRIVVEPVPQIVLEVFLVGTVWRRRQVAASNARCRFLLYVHCLERREVHAVQVGILPRRDALRYCGATEQQRRELWQLVGTCRQIFAEELLRAECVGRVETWLAGAQRWGGDLR